MLRYIIFPNAEIDEPSQQVVMSVANYKLDVESVVTLPKMPPHIPPYKHHPRNYNHIVELMEVYF